MADLIAVHLLRRDHHRHIGGDISELELTVEGLQRHGIDAMAATWEDAPERADVVNLYNLQYPVRLAEDYAEARRRWPAAATVITPIFWTYRLGEVARSRDMALMNKAARRVVRSRLTWVRCRRLLTGAGAVFVKTSAEARLLTRFFRTPMPAIIVPNAVRADVWHVDHAAARTRRADFLSAHGLDNDIRTVIASVARLDPGKNQRVLVRAAASLPDTGLVLVGPATHGRYAERVLAEADRLLPGRFAWLGPRSPVGVREVLAHADTHALPSYYEVASTVAIEAALAGCEVVMTRTAATDELWGDLVHTCAPHSVRSVIRALVQAQAIPRQPPLASRAGEFDLDLAGRAAADAYRLLVAARR
ncbi:MAG: glycosyltransferase [Acidimicrobiales bacterium]